MARGLSWAQQGREKRAEKAALAEERRVKVQFSEGQVKAAFALASTARHVCLLGGARSGKTFLVVRALLTRALKAPGSRHLIARFRGNAAWTAIAGDANSTIFTVARMCFEGGLALKQHRMDSFFELENGSTIWIGGLEDKERLDKILGREYCVSPDSKILTSDLIWVRADQIKVGTELIAFSENLDNHTKVIPSVVENAEIIQARRYRVVTDKGETVVSEGHSFVTDFDDRRHKNHRSLSWRTVLEVGVGSKIKFACDPWPVGESKEDGWLAGILDGEGWVSSGSSCGIAQKRGIVLDKIKAGLNRIGIDYSEHGMVGSKDCVTLSPSGFWMSLRMLGITRPHRLLPKARMLWNGRRGFTALGNGQYVATIQAIEPLGVGPVVALRTSTKTLIADGFLGHNSSLYLNEASEISYPTAAIALTRLAEVRPEIKQRLYVDLNPVGKTHWTNQLFIEHRDPVSKQPLENPDDYVSARLNPADNLHALDPLFIKSLESLPEKQRKRFLDGVFVDEVEGALWTYEGIEVGRRLPGEISPSNFSRVVVAIDPSGAKSENDMNADEIGIVVAAKGHDGQGYVLADRTCRASPMGWARAAVNAYHEFGGDAIVAETNYGGAMVESTIRNVDRNIKVKVVTASRGKAVRAEPISALYEQNRIHHVGRFPELEDQLCAFSSDGYRGADSPDRADACVWALTELLGIKHSTGAIEYMRQLVDDEKSRPECGPWGTKPKAEILTVKVPEGISTVYGMSGRSYQVTTSRLIEVVAMDAGPLERAGFELIE